VKPPDGWHQVCPGVYRSEIDGRRVTVKREHRHRWTAWAGFPSVEIAAATTLGGIVAAAESAVSAHA